MSEKLAIFGGRPVVRKLTTGNKYGSEEIKLLKETVQSGTLFSVEGTRVKEFQKGFSKFFGAKYAVAVSSGSAAIHVAVGALGINPGDEVITSPISDMGSIIGVLYQNAIPVFADVNPDTHTIDPKSIEKKITKKTRGIIAVHLMGLSCDMDPIMAIAKRHKLWVVEDCAQSYLSEYKGRLNGTIGDIGCFSLQESKHMSAGEGGILITNEIDLYKKAALYGDKCYYRDGSGRNPAFLAPNYRMTELQAAVALAQLKKIKEVVNAYREVASSLTGRITGINGIKTINLPKGCKHSYYLYAFKINVDTMGITAPEFGKALTAEGVPVRQHYDKLLLYAYDLFKNKSAYGKSKCPFDCHYYGKKIEYRMGMCPNAEKALQDTVVLITSRFWTDNDVKKIGEAIRKVADYYLRKRTNE